MGKRADGKAITPYKGSWAEYMTKRKEVPAPVKPTRRLYHEKPFTA